MATSLLVMAESLGNLKDEGGTGPGSEKPRNRRNGKANGSAQKKQPQRGMGVAQLERLRLQERWKKMTEFNELPSANDQLPSRLSEVPSRSFQYVPIPRRPADPIVGVPVPKVGSSHHGSVVLLQRLGNGGVQGLGGGSGCGNMMLFDQFRVDPYRIGAPDTRFQMSTMVETSTELSSMPKTHCYFDNCGACLKKKRINGEILGFNGGRGEYTEVSPVNGCDFLGLNVADNRNINERNQGFDMRTQGHPEFINFGDVDEGLEVKAVHRKGHSEGGSVLMEYEFFPAGKGSRSTSHKESKLMREEALSAAATETCRTTTDTITSVDASDSVDLSLKL